MSAPNLSPPIPTVSPSSNADRGAANGGSQPPGHGAQASSGNTFATLEDHFHTEDLHQHYPPKKRPWHNRLPSPGLKWYKKYTPENLTHGRVFVIDYVKKGFSQEGMRKVAAQEIDSYEGLCKIYSTPDRCGDAVLRVFHVQNAPWAIPFLLKKFNINTRDDLVGTDFGKYVKYKRPEQRGGKPYLNGKTWKTQHDPWRGISRTAFGIDYLKLYRARELSQQDRLLIEQRMMELNCYDEDDNPKYGYDVYVQRLSCYIQHAEPFSEVPPSPNFENPYEREVKDHLGQNHTIKLEDLDNGNAIIIFENSHSGSIEDTVISARKQWESRWRRLPFYLAYESRDVSNDASMALDCMKLILQDVWRSVSENWQEFVDTCNHHVSILEDKIYEEPADESRAPELWTNSNMWLKVERLVFIHQDVVKECQTNLRELTDDPPSASPWIESSPDDFERISNLVQEDLVKPTTNLADLMYKSVEIRDSRHSLQLSMSMWRLSWITFIFLPLTFIVSFFGMNVDIFASDPSIKWYFISVVPLMILVLISWYGLKHFLVRSRQTPYSRGIYEHLFHDLATSYPLLWTRNGPRDYVQPRGRLDRLKWWFIVRWSAPDRTIDSHHSDEDDRFDGLGAWSRCQRYLLRKWSSEIHMSENAQNASDTLLEEGTGDRTSMVANGIGEVTEMLSLPGTLGARDPNSSMLNVPLRPGTRRPISPKTIGRPSSKGSSAGRNSGVMIEEERSTWFQELAGRERRRSDWRASSLSPKRASRSSERRPDSVAASSNGNNSTARDIGQGDAGEHAARAA